MYSKIYQNILFPFYESFVRGRKTLLYLKELELTQWLSEDKLKEIQWNKLKKLLEYAYENVPFYRKRFEEQKLHPTTIKTPEDFGKLPFLTKEDIRNNQEELQSVKYKNKKIFQGATGGSTGIPLRFKLDHNNYEWRVAGVKRVYGWADCYDGEKTVFIWGGSVGKTSVFKNIKHNINEKIKRHKIYNTFYFNEQNMNKCLQEINKFKPKFIVAYTTPIYNFAKFIKKNSKKVWAPKSIIVAAEKLFPHQKGLIEDVFNSAVFETYGCREVTSIAGECKEHSGMHINIENIYMEIFKKNEPAKFGESGEIIVTDLTNYCMPLIRYKNGDIGSFLDEKCKCGRNLPLLGKIEGRLLDTIQTTDGKLIPGEFFPHLMKEFEEIERFQVIQENINSLIVKIVKKEEFSKSKIEFMKKEILKVIGKEISLEIKFVDTIPLTNTGKHRVVISKVPVDFGNR